MANWNGIWREGEKVEGSMTKGLAAGHAGARRRGGAMHGTALVCPSALVRAGLPGQVRSAQLTVLTTSPSFGRLALPALRAAR
jgi:hypothetical protein